LRNEVADYTVTGPVDVQPGFRLYSLFRQAAFFYSMEIRTCCSSPGSNNFSDLSNHSSLRIFLYFQEMIQLRQVEETDDSFIESVYASTRQDVLGLTNWPEQQKKAFIIMQSMAQLAEYKKSYPGAAFQIIMYKKKPAGRFYTWENDDEFRLIDITLLPLFRGKGIGSFLLKELIKKSNTTAKKISLHVEPINPALHLYRRLGFIYIKNNGRYFYMERKPEVFSNDPKQDK
jgi:ribosomal protein S18 acetylase RimI-like enzyme